MSKDTILIIPAYNEEKSIGSVLTGLGEAGVFKKMDVLVINDGSSDKMLDVIAPFTEVKVISQIFNMGYGAALQTGYKYAEEKGYQYLLQMDADGQHDLKNLDLLLGRIKGETPFKGNAPKNDRTKSRLPDIVIGSRFLKDSKSFKVSGLKKFAISLFNLVITRQTGYRLTDPTSGLQAMNRRAICCYAEYNQFDIEYPDINMIIQMLYKGFHIEEVPAIMHERTAGVSMHSSLLKSGVYMLIMAIAVIRISWQIPRNKRFKYKDEQSFE